MKKNLVLVSQTTHVTVTQIKRFLPALSKYAALVKAAYPEVPDLTITTSATPTKFDWVAYIKDNMPSGVDGYHTFGNEGIAVIDVKANNWRELLSHELAESLVDPTTGATAEIIFKGSKLTILKEVCDPVNSHTFKVGNFQLADFVYPAWFSTSTTPTAGARYNQRNTIHAPGKCDSGGYVVDTHGRVHFG